VAKKISPGDFALAGADTMRELEAAAPLYTLQRGGRLRPLAGEQVAKLRQRNPY
jgi:hypothetical protein